MREIKFRGYSNILKKWIYGDLIHDNNGEKYVINAGDFDSDMPIFINEETIGQFTGGKDKNCKEIYEGDIVILRDISRSEEIIEFPPRLVKWCEIGLAYNISNYGNEISYEVIGNTTENPELLESEV